MKEKAKRAITKLKHPLPSYRLAFDKHFEIIKAYVVASNEGNKAISWKDLTKIVSVNPSLVSANNKFFQDLGLIREAEKQRGKYYPTKNAVDFSKIRDWDEDKAKNILRELILKSWFWESTRQLLEVRKKVSEKELLGKLGIDSGADPKKHLPSLKVIVEYLKYVELICEEDGTITYGKFGLKEKPTQEISLPKDKDMIQIRIEEELFAVDVKELKDFVRKKGKKLNSHIYRLA